MSPAEREREMKHKYYIYVNIYYQCYEKVKLVKIMKMCTICGLLLVVNAD